MHARQALFLLLPLLLCLVSGVATSQEGVERRAAAVAADSWPSWRGPLGTGASATAKPPLEWSEENNVRWKVDVPGLGSSTPVVQGNRIYVTTAVETERDVTPTEPAAEVPPQLQRALRPRPTKVHAFQVLALDRADGRIIWRTTVAEAVPPEGGHRTANYASGSPILDGDRLYAFFGSQGLHALDLDGVVLWSRDFGDMLTMMTFGEGASPTLWGDTLVVVWDHEGDSFVVALDKRSGEERWRKPRDEGTTWATPLVVAVGDGAQVIVPGVKASRAYDLATGEVVWSCSGMSRAIIPTPVEIDGTVVLMSSFRIDAIQAIRLAGAKGDVTDTEHVVWSRARDASYVPSPLLYYGRLYFVRKSSGVLTCLDAATGAVCYEGERLRAVKEIYASPIGADGRVYLASREGITVVVKAGPEFEKLATNELDDVFDATPVAVGGELYLRGEKHLYCIAEGAATSTPKGEQADAGWVPLFNGRDLTGWAPKITGYPLGENFANTFRVEDGVLKVVYDGYEDFGGRFGHLFFDREFASYRLRVEYRFTGDQVPGGPGWAFRNSGVMIHGQPAASMAVDQDFPASIEVQLLGGRSEGERATANLCTPGTHVVMDGKLVTRHCTDSKSKTYRGDDWVTVEVEVRGNTIRHVIDGETVLTYGDPQLDPKAPDAAKLLAAGRPLMLTKGTLSLQSESHPVEFRKVEILVLDDGGR